MLITGTTDHLTVLRAGIWTVKADTESYGSGLIGQSVHLLRDYPHFKGKGPEQEQRVKPDTLPV